MDDEASAAAATGTSTAASRKRRHLTECQEELDWVSTFEFLPFNILTLQAWGFLLMI